MAAKKYLIFDLVANAFKYIAAIVVSTGAPNDGDLVALDTTGHLDPSVLPPGAGPKVKVLPISEDVVAGNQVNIYDVAGVETVRKADASVIGKMSHGFVLDSVTYPGNVMVYFPGETNTSLSGLISGSMYYLSATTPGALVTDVSGYTGGQIIQPIGIPLSATEVNMLPPNPVVTA